MKRKPEIVIVSGLRLGSDSCRANELMQYFKSVRPATLVLNGGFFDGQVRSLARFPKSHLKVLRYLLKMAAAGTRIWYVGEPSDPFVGALGEFSLGQIEFRERIVLQAGGVKYLVHPGGTDAGPSFFAQFLKKIRSISGWKRVEKSTALRENASRWAQKANCEAIICANDDRPKIRNAATDDTFYLNTGLWSPNCTALEFAFSKWTLFKHHPADFEVQNPKLTVKQAAVDEEKEAFKSEDWAVYQTGI